MWQRLNWTLKHKISVAGEGGGITGWRMEGVACAEALGVKEAPTGSGVRWRPGPRPGVYVAGVGGGGVRSQAVSLPKSSSG